MKNIQTVGLTMHIGWTDRQIDLRLIEMINSDGKWQSFNNLCPILAITSLYVCQSSYVKGDEK